MTIITQALAPEALEVALTSESQELLDQLLESTLLVQNLVLDLPSAAIVKEDEEDQEEDNDDSNDTNQIGEKHKKD